MKDDKGENFWKQMEELPLYDTPVDSDKGIETTMSQKVDIPAQNHLNMNTTNDSSNYLEKKQLWIEN